MRGGAHDAPAQKQQYISRATYDQAEALTGYERGTLCNMAYVAKQIKSSSRDEHLSWKHHVAVTPLAPDEQRDWLAKAAEKGWSVAALEPAERQAAKARQETTRLAGREKGGAPKRVGAGKLPAPKGDTRDQVARYVGVSGRTLEKMAEVVGTAPAQEQPEAVEIASSDEIG